jgi:cyclophilin family peptidyl-prolyl cis-trans isomerase/HEAT repeat protein
LLLVAVLAGACASTPAPPAPVPAPPSYEERLGWILRLEDRRVMREVSPGAAPAVLPVPGTGAPAAQATADLTRLLVDGDARLRRRAALGIGRVGLAEGVPRLVEALDDPDPDVREAVCFALGLLRDRSAVPVLVSALGDERPGVQGRAAEALGSIGDPSVAAAIGAVVRQYAAHPAVTGLAEDDPGSDVPPEADAFRLGLYALVRLKAWEPLAAATLDGRGEPRVRWWPVAYALQRIEDPRAGPALLALTKARGTDTVAFAARGLGVLKEPRGVAALQPLLDPATHALRVVATAARALGQIGAAEAVPALRRLLRDARLDHGTRVEVVTALGRVKHRAALEDLVDFLGHPAPAVRGAALIAIAASDQDTFITVLSGLDADPAWQVRVDLAQALGTIERERAEVRLGQLLRDDDARVAAAALRALAALGVPDVAARARQLLLRDDLALRAAAAAVIGDTRPAGGEAWLRDAWERGRSDDSHVARAAALAALARYGAREAGPTLEAALADPDWAVRLHAWRLLREIDPQADPMRIRPAPTAPEVDHGAASLLAPAFSPQVYLETDRGTIQLELLVLDAPLTCANFVALARRGFFDGLPIHRVVPNFVVQAGDPRGDGEGGPGHTLRDELNERPYLRGTVGMALDWADTGGSQFFITHGPQPHLDGHYTVFGTVVAGMDVVDRLERWDVITRVRVWDGVQPPTS